MLLHGDDLDGQGDVAAAVAAQLGVRLLRVRAEDLPSTSAEIDAFAVLWQREAALLGAVLLVECRNPEVPKSVSELAERVGTLIFIAGREPVPLSRENAALSRQQAGAGRTKTTVGTGSRRRRGCV